MSSCSKISVISYNLHGLNQGTPGITELITKIEPDLIMVQEHWLSSVNLSKLNSLSSNYFVFGSSAMNIAVSSGPLYGRPFGGTAILIKNDHISSAVCVSTGDRFTAWFMCHAVALSNAMICIVIF